MATIKMAKIGSKSGIGPGKTYHFRWNNPPWNTVLNYWAVPQPEGATGPHGFASAEVQVTKVTVLDTQDNYNAEQARHADIYIKNVGGTTCGFDLYQSWIE